MLSQTLTTIGVMAEKSIQSSPGSAGTFSSLGVEAAPVVYGITALHYEGALLSTVMMGMFDPELERWELRPAPTRLVEVVDRLVEGDTVISLFPAERGTLTRGPEVKVDVLASGVETLALAQERPGRLLADMRQF